MSLRARLRAVKIQLLRLRYRAFLVHRTTYLAAGSQIHASLAVGHYGYIGPRAEIPPLVSMGNYVMIGPDLLITGRDHIFDNPGTAVIFSGRPSPASTRIEDDVWIGARVTIMRGVTIGRGAIIATGSIVTSDVQPYSIMAGVPARPIRQRFSEEQQAIHDRFLKKPPVAGNFCTAVE